MERSSPWKSYHEGSREKPPRESLVAALEYVEDRESALDFGAGALRDTKFLLKSDFHHVTAVDGEAAILDFAKEIGDSRLEAVVSSFEDFDFKFDSYNLINAQFSLPFTSPEKFGKVFQRLKASLKKEGVFVGQLFGLRDSWSGNASMTFHSRDQVEALFSDMQILELREIERDDRSETGDAKHWHVFHITAKKI